MQKIILLLIIWAVIFSGTGQISHSFGHPTDVKLIPMGSAIGVRINTDGVMVLGTGSFLGADGETHSPSQDLLRAGDLIFMVNSQPIFSKEYFSEMIAQSTGDVTVNLRRDNKKIEVVLTPQQAATDDNMRIGAWVRDSTKGIGTLTFFNPSNNTFGALGHGIMDVDTRKLMSVKSGKIMPSDVSNVKRGLRGSPGELEGIVDTHTTLGTITNNSQSGIYGTMTAEAAKKLSERKPMPIAGRNQIRVGKASVLTSVSNTIQEFEIQIEGINRFSQDETKGLIIRITDPELLEITGGIVQGMSGSPILQNGKLVGAITHVFVQDPTKGYGIFIENMLH